MLPRVTEILKPFTGIEFVPKDILASSAARGTKVHAICAGIAKGAWVPHSSIDEELLGYVKSFERWADAQVKNFQIIETRYEHEDLGFTGQVDFVVTGFDEHLYLVDIKTSAKPRKTYPLQLAAYRELLSWHDIYVQGAMLVYLNAAGDFPEIQLLDHLNEELCVFRGALTCFKYFHQEKKSCRKPR